MLQSPKLDLSKAVDLIGALKQTFEVYRSETYLTFSGMRLCRHVTAVVFLQTCHSISEKKLLSRTLQGFVITSTVGQDVKIDSKETFKLHV